MKRRDFFKTATLGSGALALSPLLACTPTLREKKKEESVAGFDRDTELDEKTVHELQQMMESGESTSVEIIDSYLKRIREIDADGPELKSIIEMNPDVLEISAKRDHERKLGKIRGPLHGIPIIIKDNIDTGDGMHTTAGSMALADFKAEKDAFIVQKLRQAGAVLLGKANLSEWANIRSTRSSSGWSGRGGQVRNPYILDRSPCGSSSGTAVAVSANLSTLGIGTETDGSIVCPASMNGIVGIKPTLGLWSRHGIIPIAHSQDTAGPMARTVEDAAFLLTALSGFDSYDPLTAGNKERTHTDYTKFLDKNSLQGARIGIVKDFYGFDPNVDALLEIEHERMRDLGAELMEVECAENRDEWGKAEWTVLLYELKNDLNKYLGEHQNAKMRSLADIIAFNKENAYVEMPWFGQEIFLEAENKGSLEDKEYLEALKISKTLSRKAIDDAIDQNKLDALIAPSNAPAWTIDWVNGDHFVGSSSDLAAVSGYPGITVPAGFIHGLPIGLSFIGKAWSERTLINLAYGYEQNTLHRKKPTFIGSIR